MQYGFWTVIKYLPKLQAKHKQVEVQCVCGALCIVGLDALLRGKTRSCGCKRAFLSADKIAERAKRQCDKRNKAAVGKTFGRLTIVSDISECGDRSYVRAKCSCGVEKDVNISAVLAGGTKSCGCLRRELARTRALKDNVARATHRMSGSRMYRTWTAMMHRCNDPTDVNWKHYGGRGIKVCKRWYSFEKFFKDMGYPPSPDMQIDRRNNDGGYKPSNCRWVTRKENMSNTRARKVVNPRDKET